MRGEGGLPGASIAREGVLALRLWLRLLEVVMVVEKALSSRLQRSFGLTLARFDVLAQLARYPEGLTMKDLSEKLLVTAGNVTRLTSQLERAGLIRKEKRPEDGRKVFLTLTPEGRELFERMAREHREWLEELLSGLSPEDMEALYGLLAKLKAHLRSVQSREVT